MAGALPYVSQPGSVARILDKIKEAKAPDRFTQDYLKTKLGFNGGNYRQFIPFAKKLGLLKSDGAPTDLYKKYRNSGESKAALAEAIKNGYREAFERNEYANGLTKEQFKGLVVEITGSEPTSRTVQLICQTFETLKPLADFDATLEPDGADHEGEGEPREESEDRGNNSDLKLNLAYTINLVLPKTDDPAVFNAIFRSLRENLLRK